MCYDMQLCMQKVLATAVRTVMMKLMIVFQFAFFIVVSLGLCSGNIPESLVREIWCLAGRRVGLDAQMPVQDGVLTSCL